MNNQKMVQKNMITFTANACALIAVTAISSTSAAFAPGIVRSESPPMGWRSWNWYQCNISEVVMKAQVSDSVHCITLSVLPPTAVAFALASS